MVAATNPAVNNVIARALSSNPASHASAAKPGNANTAAGKMQSAGNPADDNEFTSLLNTFLGDDTSAASASGDNSATTKPAANGKDDQKGDAGATAAATPQWLIAPLTMPAVPAAPAANNAAATDDGSADAVGALSAAGNAASNALLAQNLKQSSKQSIDDKHGATDTTDQKSGATAPEFLLNAQTDQAALGTASQQQDAALQDKALLAVTDKGKETRTGNDVSNNQTLNAVQQMATLQASSTTNNATPVAQYQIHAEMGTHQWAAEVGNRLDLMVSHNVQSASLQLTPDHLGPVQVRIDVNHNQASVWFTADHPDTRTALEQSLPQLRQLFASQGMSLMDAGVFGQPSQQPPAYVAPPPQFSAGITDMSSEATVTQQVLKIGLLDTYA